MDSISKVDLSLLIGIAGLLVALGLGAYLIVAVVAFAAGKLL